MPRAFTFSWTPDGYRGFKDGDPLDYSGGNDLKALEKGDRLFILTLLDGAVYLLGAMTVGRVVDEATALRVRGGAYEGSEHHVLAQSGTATGFGFREVQDLDSLRFITRSGEAGLKLKNGRPDSQTLRRLRRITDNTADYLESLVATGGSTSTGAGRGLSMLTDPSAVRAAMSEFSSLGRTKFLQKYGYKKSTRYLIFDGEDHYDSKAIAGVAFGFQHPELGPLKPGEFSGGESTAVKKLESLGFEVVEQGPGVDWTPEENAAVVAAYFEMLAIQARNEKLNKSAHNAALRAKLRRRTRGSIERKLMNVTAALVRMSKPTLDGYAPNENLQDDLGPAIEEYLARHQPEVERTYLELEASEQPKDESFDEVLMPAPTPKISGKGRPHGVFRPIPKRLDFAARDEANRKLGLMGEEWVVRYEKHRLTQGGRPDLAAAVEHVALTQGDGHGYDIESFDLDGTRLRIEVKTTNAGAMSAFLLSPNELAASGKYGKKFRLYRVHGFKTKPRLFVLQGPLDQQLVLEPAEYRARLRPVESGGEPEEDD